MSNKLVTCNKCGAPDLKWGTTDNGRWCLIMVDGSKHRCEGAEPTLVKCKYCPADDLHWMRETMPDGVVRPVLTESFGIPHACDERREFFEKQKKLKRDTYDAEKARILSMTTLSKMEKDRMLYDLRKRIWPGIYNKRRQSV